MVGLALRGADAALVGALVSSDDFGLTSGGDLSSTDVTLGAAALVCGGELSLASVGDLGSAATGETAIYGGIVNNYGVRIARFYLRRDNNTTHLVIYGVSCKEPFTEGHFDLRRVIVSGNYGGDASVIYGGEFIHPIYGACRSKLTMRST